MKNILLITLCTLSINAFCQTPNEKPTIKIYEPPTERATLQPTSQPLLIVDGAIFHFNDSLAFNNKLKDIKPDDIQSIDVLKGEKATAQFGEKGQNGVIIVTMKKSEKLKRG